MPTIFDSLIVLKTAVLEIRFDHIHHRWNMDRETRNISPTISEEIKLIQSLVEQVNTRMRELAGNARFELVKQESSPAN